MKKIYILLLVVILFLFTFIFFAIDAQTTKSPVYEPEPNLKVAFIGDQGASDASKAVLNLIKDEEADMVLHQGDFDYDEIFHYDDGLQFDKQINSILGEDFPYFASVGNHDVSRWPEYQKMLKDRLSRIEGADCEGDLGVQSSCHYKGLFFILSGAGTLGDKHDKYIRDELRKDNSVWSICSWHKNQRFMQVGGKESETGWDVYEECRKGGAIIATGHEHSYSRTYLMNSFERQEIANTDDNLEIKQGQTFAFVNGLGGLTIRPQLLSGDWWASIYTETQGANYGALFCTFNVDNDPRVAECYFKNIDGEIIDSFTLESKI